MVILVLNCGSSSIKYQVIDMVSPRENSLLAKGLVERIGIEGGIITHKPTGKPRLELHDGHSQPYERDRPYLQGHHRFRIGRDSLPGRYPGGRTPCGARRRFLRPERARGRRGDKSDRTARGAGPAAQPGQPERYLRREGASVRPYRRWYVSIRRSTSPCRPAATSTGFPINITSSTA